MLAPAQPSQFLGAAQQQALVAALRNQPTQAMNFGSQQPSLGNLETSQKIADFWNKTEQQGGGSFWQGMANKFGGVSGG